MRWVRFDFELLAEGGLHKKTSRDNTSHAGRSHTPTSIVPNGTDEDGIRETLKIKKSEVEL